jgi:hypothetical protein
MIVKLKRRPKPELDAQPDPEEVIDTTIPLKGPWSATDLYARSPENRRIMLLELMAWAIYQAETCGTRAEFAAFEQELREVRKQEWGKLPWFKAHDPARFLRHVENMAEEFTADNPRWRLRLHSPTEDG